MTLGARWSKEAAMLRGCTAMLASWCLVLFSKELATSEPQLRCERRLWKRAPSNQQHDARCSLDCQHACAAAVHHGLCRMLLSAWLWSTTAGFYQHWHGA